MIRINSSQAKLAFEAGFEVYELDIPPHYAEALITDWEYVINKGIRAFGMERAEYDRMMSNGN